MWYNTIMNYFSEIYIKNSKLCKTKKHFYICPKCGLVQVCPADDSYSFGLCWICFLKSQGYYKSAMREIKLDWFTWHTKMDFNEGWSIKSQYLTIGLMLAILKCGSLNKTPKTSETIRDYFSDYWIKKFGE